MTQTGSDLEHVLVTERANWIDGPPHELFAQLRSECPVHWTSRVSEYPDEEGYWSVTRAEDIHTVSRDWRTYSSERGGITAITDVFPLDLMRAMFIGMDPPKHDRLKMLFQAGFTRGGSPTTRTPSGASSPMCSTGSTDARSAISSTRSPNQSSPA